MGFRQIHSILSFRSLLNLLIGLAIVVQIVVISFNHFSGYYVLDGTLHFLSRFLRGFALSLLASFLIAYPDLFVIQYMNRIAPWAQRVFKRITIQLGLTVLIAAVISILVTAFAHWINPYTEELRGVYISNILIYIVVNIMIVAVLEGWIFFIESDRAWQKAEYLQEELSQIKFEVLKSQINPHFMFNSLNVLSGLINTDTDKAQQFIDEFSQIYRYVLETIEKQVTPLGKELEFMRSYLFLQQMRYGNTLSYSVDIPSAYLEWVLPPLSLQVLLENAIKHNIVNESKPLIIEIYCINSFLVVKNNIQPKISGHSTGLGLKNLIKRYDLICDIEPIFKLERDFYIAKIPLLNID